MKNVYYEAVPEHQRYEDLMRWTISNYEDLIKSDKLKYNSQKLMMDIMNMDIGCIISNNDDYVAFIEDLKQRTGMKLASERKKGNILQKQLTNIKDNHMSLLNDWEQSFITNLMNRKVEVLSDKQKSCLSKITSKIGGEV